MYAVIARYPGVVDASGSIGADTRKSWRPDGHAK
jgi:hypothetical protein